jgi:hypothetical protein
MIKTLEHTVAPTGAKVKLTQLGDEQIAVFYLMRKIRTEKRIVVTVADDLGKRWSNGRMHKLVNEAGRKMGEFMIVAKLDAIKGKQDGWLPEGVRFTEYRLAEEDSE